MATSPSPARARRDGGQRGLSTARKPSISRRFSPTAATARQDRPRGALPAPAEGAFRYLKVARKNPHGASVLSIAALLPVDGGKLSGPASPWRDGPAADPRQGGREGARRQGARRRGDRRGGQGRGRGHRAGGRSAGERLVPAGSAAGASRAGCCRARRRADGQGSRHFTVNGDEQAEFVEAGALLVDVLRDKLGLTGTQGRLRPGHLRHLHGADRRRAGAVLPDARRRGRNGAAVDDGRGPRHRRRACIRSSAPSSTASPRSAASARRA